MEQLNLEYIGVTYLVVMLLLVLWIAQMTHSLYSQVEGVKKVKLKRNQIFKEARDKLSASTEPSARRKHVHLSKIEKNELCDYAREHPRLSQTDIAAYYGIGASTVSAILKEDRGK